MPTKKHRSERKAKPSGQVVSRSLDRVVGRGKWRVRVLVCGKWCGEYRFRTEERATEFADNSRVLYGALGCSYFVHHADESKDAYEAEAKFYDSIYPPNPNFQSGGTP